MLLLPLPPTYPPWYPPSFLLHELYFFFNLNDQLSLTSAAHIDLYMVPSPGVQVNLPWATFLKKIYSLSPSRHQLPVATQLSGLWPHEVLTPWREVDWLDLLQGTISCAGSWEYNSPVILGNTVLKESSWICGLYNFCFPSSEMFPDL